MPFSLIRYLNFLWQPSVNTNSDLSAYQQSSAVALWANAAGFAGLFQQLFLGGWFESDRPLPLFCPRMAIRDLVGFQESAMMYFFKSSLNVANN